MLKQNFQSAISSECVKFFYLPYHVAATDNVEGNSRRGTVVDGSQILHECADFVCGLDDAVFRLVVYEKLVESLVVFVLSCGGLLRGHVGSDGFVRYLAALLTA